jgi:hypothetical protein
VCHDSQVQENKGKEEFPKWERIGDLRASTEDELFALVDEERGWGGGTVGTRLPLDVSLCPRMFVPGSDFVRKTVAFFEARGREYKNSNLRSAEIGGSYDRERQK